MIFALAALLLVTALVLLWISWNERRETGLPPGRVVYSDTSRWTKVEKPLYDPLAMLTGRPDYLVEENGVMIPVEVKSGRAPSLPYDSHVYQLAAYCMLVERVYRKRPPYGILRYRDKTFTIEYTSLLEQELQALLDEIHRQERYNEIDRSHNEPARCARCGYRAVCDQRL